jgi:hypothetical protein
VTLSDSVAYNLWWLLSKNAYAIPVDFFVRLRVKPLQQFLAVAGIKVVFLPDVT